MNSYVVFDIKIIGIADTSKTKCKFVHYMFVYAFMSSFCAAFDHKYTATKKSVQESIRFLFFVWTLFI